MIVLARVKDQGVMIGNHLITVKMVMPGAFTFTVKDEVDADKPFSLYLKAGDILVPIEAEPKASWEFTAKLDQPVFFAPNIFFVACDIRGDKVRIGGDVPPEVPMHRYEVWLAIKRENEANQQKKE